MSKCYRNAGFISVTTYEKTSMMLIMVQSCIFSNHGMGQMLKSLCTLFYGQHWIF